MAPVILLKYYVDQAVQTEIQDSSFERPVLRSTHASNTDIGLAALATLEESSVASPSPSASASRCSSKRSQLLYSRPTESYVLAKRIVSLPKSSFDASGDLRLSRDAARMRIVSLPETTKYSPRSVHSMSYQDSFGASSENSRTSSGNDLNHPRFRTYSRLDVPYTPSPPSSPDSVLIIDKDVHLPNLVLYGRSRNNTTTEDDEGWITWASSPPRPIPALHGPLSLPYARCPSGAEGTIIEDRDLPRMIWGLDPQALRGPPGSTRNQRSLDDHNPTAKDLASRLQAAPRIPQEQPLSTIHSPNSELCILDTGDSDSVDAIFKRESVIEDINKSVHHDDFPSDNGSRICRETYFKPSAPKNSYSTKRHLRSSGPIFIPTVSDNVLAGNVMESCASQVLSLKPRTLVALDIARQYCMDQKNNALPTPPASSAPQWSPVLSSHAPLSQPNKWKLPHDQQTFLGFASVPTPSEADPQEEDQIMNQSSAKYNLGLHHLASDWMRLRFPERPSQKANEKSCCGGPPNALSLCSDSTHRATNSSSAATPFGISNQRIPALYSHSKPQRTSAVAEGVRSSSRTVLSATQSKQGVYADPAGCVQLSTSRYPLSGFNHFHTETPNSAELNLGPDLTHNVFLRNMKLPVEPTPIVKLPLTAPKFSDRKHEASVNEEQTHRDYGKENTSKAKATDSTLQKRVRTRKRNTKPNDNQDKLS